MRLRIKHKLLCKFTVVKCIQSYILIFLKIEKMNYKNLACNKKRM